MKVYVLYRPKSEHERRVITYVHDFLRAQPTRLVRMLNIDSKEGTDMAMLYDITQYPAVLAMTNDGQLQKSWQGDLPLMDELAYYATDQ
jgi:hypothetical protein